VPILFFILISVFFCFCFSWGFFTHKKGGGFTPAAAFTFWWVCVTSHLIQQMVKISFNIGVYDCIVREGKFFNESRRWNSMTRMNLKKKKPHQSGSWYTRNNSRLEVRARTRHSFSSRLFQLVTDWLAFGMPAHQRERPSYCTGWYLRYISI
jgi:hypothetical protein